MLFIPFYILGLVLLGSGPGTIDYPVYYVATCALLLVLIITGDVTDKLVGAFLLLYLSIALLNISSYRGYITVETALVVYVYVLVVTVPAFFSHARSLVDAARRGNVANNARMGWPPRAIFMAGELFWVVLAAHLITVWVVLAYVLGTIGNTFFNTELRFQIPTWAAYAIRSGCVVPVLLYALDRSPPGRFVLALMSVAPAVLIGARGTVVLFVLASFLVVVLAKPGWKIRWRFTELSSAVSLRARLVVITFFIVVIASGFYLRRSSNSTLVTARQLIEIYFDYSGVWLYLILPFYQGFRETIGVTNQIIERGLDNASGSILFVKELGTVLPGEHVAPGQYLGDLLGRVGEGGLTPGLIGGTYIDFGLAGAVVFLLLWLGGRFMYRLGRVDPRFLILYAVYLTQFMHLFHRGFLKLEYLTFLLIAAGYLMLIRGNLAVELPSTWRRSPDANLVDRAWAVRAGGADR